MLEKIRTKIAWWNDHGSPMNEPWMSRNLQRNSTVCDIGCGNGDTIELLNRLGHKATGIDPDPDARDFARSRGLDVFAGTAEELPHEIDQARFDCVLMSHALEHALEPQAAIANATRLLSPGGILIVETPNNEARGLAQSKQLWPWLDVPRHLNFFTGKSLGNICVDAGELVVKHKEYRGYTRQFKSDWIENERQILDVCATKGPASSTLRASSPLKSLRSTAFAQAKFKCDSVRVIAKRI